MPANPKRSTVHGSERIPLHDARAMGPIPQDERFEVTVRVRPRAPLPNSTARKFTNGANP